MSEEGPGGILNELKRRKVFRAGAVYAGVGFVVAQAADIAFPALGLPDQALTLVVVLVILGFPVALVLAWAFELTPDGLVREEPDPASTALPRARGPNPLAFWAGVGGLGVVGMALFFLGRGMGGGLAPRVAEAGIIERSIAVLPLQDLSPGRDHEWFADGITEDILLHLSRIGDLKVIGKTSVMRYKDREATARQIGAELGVATVLVGSLRRDGERVRVSVQHIHAVDDRQLWAESFDRELTDIFRIQSEIARQIAEILEVRLSPEERGRLAASPTDDIRAYDLFLRGREHGQRLTREDLTIARSLFREAIHLDPEFPEAHAGLAYAFSAMTGYHHDGTHWLDSAYVAASRAVELDRDGAAGLRSLALVQWNGGDMEEAVETYLRALSRQPNDAESYWGLAFIRWLQGRTPDALHLSERSVELDPGHPGNITKLGRILATLGETGRGIELFRAAMTIQPDFPWAHQDLIWVLLGAGRLDEVRGHLRRIEDVPALAGEHVRGTFLLALEEGRFQDAAAIYARAGSQVQAGIVGAAEVGLALQEAGQEERARQVLAGWAEGEGTQEGFFATLIRGRIAAVRGETDAALRHLEEARQMGWLGYPYMDISRDPVLAALRDDPRLLRIRDGIRRDLERMRAEVEASTALQGPLGWAREAFSRPGGFR
jgi:TolB-like protein/Tfp pilus assembly protein PilF